MSNNFQRVFWFLFCDFQLLFIIIRCNFWPSAPLVQQFARITWMPRLRLRLCLAFRLIYGGSSYQAFHLFYCCCCLNVCTFECMNQWMNKCDCVRVKQTNMNMSMSMDRNICRSISMSMCKSMSISMSISKNICTSMSIIYINTVERQRVSSHLANISAGVEWHFVLLLLITVVVVTVVTVVAACCCCLLRESWHAARLGTWHSRAHTNPKRRCWRHSQAPRLANASQVCSNRISLFLNDFQTHTGKSISPQTDKLNKSPSCNCSGHPNKKKTTKNPMRKPLENKNTPWKTALPKFN